MSATPRMPAGRQFALTWAIPADFGGLTIAMLRRSRAFSDIGGVAVQVLTLDPEENRVERDRALVDRGHDADGVDVLNLYDWLRAHPLSGGSLRLQRDPFTPLAPTEGETQHDTADGPARRTVRRDGQGRILQIDHLREDGSIVLSDRRDTRTRGRVGGRSLVLCDGDGHPLRSWRAAAHLYAAWLDALTAGAASFVLVDSKAAARFVLDYRRRHVTTVHVVHGSHLDASGEGIRASRREVFDRLGDFDAVAFATRAQRDDVRAVAGRLPFLVTVPHALPAVGGSAETDGPRRGSAVASRLVPLKRVEDAVRAIQRANEGAGEPIPLDVYGEGSRGEHLRALAAADDHIRFHGLVPDVPSHLVSTSTLLMTSTSEAFGLAIGEAMSVGCLPISYDVRYGPSDLIDHGRNGWLVPDGDVAALARVVRAAADLGEDELAAMRQRARRRAAEYTDARVVETWAGALARARRRKRMSGAARALLRRGRALARRLRRR